MNKEFARGLVVGKFAPLHRGHELLIRRAAECCEEVLIVSYSRPEIAGCEPEKRARWLAELFPSARSLVLSETLLQARMPGIAMPANDASATAHRRFVARVCREIFESVVDAVFTSEDYGDGFAAELTAFFREHDPAAPAVRHILVDRARCQIPISGSAIRAGVHAHRHWLSPVVYGDFVERVCLLGGESSGKSTLAAALAAEFQTVHVEEYGRELWESRGGKLSPEDMLHIAERQVAQEAAAARRARRFVFCDTSPLTTLFYSGELFGCATPELERLALRRYALAVVCAPDFPFVQDGTRRDTAFRARQHAWYLEQLARTDQPWMVAAGPVEERLRAIGDALLYA
ncbi:MAG: AAA family ATPase [Verrucomicrobiota bacterium]|nr:AAA family ATPase [Verrucomicrobiota bacterium]